MDYGAPRSFELLFKQYDALRRARLSMLLQKAKSSDHPPWDTPGGEKNPPEAAEAETTTLPGPPPPRREPSSSSMGPTETSWNDAVAARMEKAEKRLNDDSLGRDETGLDKAYNKYTRS